MATLQNFRAQFPEFNGVSDILVNTMLNAAFLELDTSVWGAYGTSPPAITGGQMGKVDQGQMYLAAHKLAISPWGQNAKLVVNNRSGYQRTTYGQEFALLQRGVTGGFRVA